MGDTDCPDFRIYLAPPMIKKIEEHRKIRCRVVLLPRENLEKGGIIRHGVTNLSRSQTVSLQLNQERPVGHSEGLRPWVP